MTLRNALNTTALLLSVATIAAIVVGYAGREIVFFDMALGLLGIVLVLNTAVNSLDLRRLQRAA